METRVVWHDENKEHPLIHLINFSCKQDLSVNFYLKSKIVNLTWLLCKNLVLCPFCETPRFLLKGRSMNCIFCKKLQLKRITEHIFLLSLRLASGRKWQKWYQKLNLKFVVILLHNYQLEFFQQVLKQHLLMWSWLFIKKWWLLNFALKSWQSGNSRSVK